MTNGARPEGESGEGLGRLLGGVDTAIARILEGALEGREVTVEGVAYRSQPRPDGFLVPTDPTPQPGKRLEAWFRVDIDRIQQQVAEPLLPVFVRQSAASAGAMEPPLPQPEPELSEGSHLGYAVQWFSFALILVTMYSAFVWQEYKRKLQER